MKYKTKNTIKVLILVGAFILSACSQEEPSNKSKIDKKTNSSVVDTHELSRKNAFNQNAAEEIALLAEKILPYPGGFIHANKIFDQALTLDPKNTRALFYKGVLAPVMAQKGILTRIKPWIAKQDTETQNEHQEAVSKIKNPDTIQFLNDGPQDLDTIAHIQNYLEEVGNSLMSGRELINTIKMSPITLTLPLKSINQNDPNCYIQVVSEGVYKIPQCLTDEDYYQVRVARPDYEAISLGYLSIAVSTTWFYTAYSLEGLERVQKAIDMENQKIGYRDLNKIYEIIKSEPEFLKIRNPNALKKIITLGQEGMEALRYALKNQPELCKNGSATSENRKGFLVSEGLCVSETISHSMMTFNAIIEGPYEIEKKAAYLDNPSDIRRYVTEINVGQFLNHPPTDLKALLPSYDKSTMRHQFLDDTLGGLFPRGDASNFFNFGIDLDVIQVVPVKELK